MSPRLYVTDRGDGEPVLAITGWTISSAVFDPVAGLYVPHLRMITYDHRGSGRSGSWPAPVSMAMLAADAARVLDERGVAAAHVVGLSMGALVALELSVRFPSRVKSLVLVGGGPGGPSTAVPGLSTVASVVSGLAADLANGTWPSAVLFSPAFRRAQPERVRELCRPFQRFRPPPWTIGWQTVAASCFSRAGDLDRVRCPTLIVHGSKDVMSPPANGRMLAAGIPGAELWSAWGAGHAVPLELAEESAERLRAWTARHAHLVPDRATFADGLAERVSRPFALHAGAMRSWRGTTGAIQRRLGC